MERILKLYLCEDLIFLTQKYARVKQCPFKNAGSLIYDKHKKIYCHSTVIVHKCPDFRKTKHWDDDFRLRNQRNVWLYI